MSAQNPNMPNPNVPQGYHPDVISNERSMIEVAHESSQIALTGLMLAASDRRMRRAGDRMEHMDHKEAFYNDMGRLALNGGERVSQDMLQARWDLLSLADYPPQAPDLIAAVTKRATGESIVPWKLNDDDVRMHRDKSGETHPFEFVASPTAGGKPASARTFAERWIEGRFDKKGVRYANAKTRLYNVENTLGEPRGSRGRTKKVVLGSTIPGFNKREKGLMKLALTANQFLGINMSRTLEQNGLNPLDQRNTPNTPLDTTGMTPEEAAWATIRRGHAERLDNNTHKYKPSALAELRRNPNGRQRLSAAERRVERNRIAALPRKLGNDTVSKPHREKARSELVKRLSLKFTTSKPISSRMHRKSRDQAIDKIILEHKRSEELREKKAALEAKRDLLNGLRDNTVMHGPERP